MDKKYDLSLPVWGPYNKNYLGVAHTADFDKGYRFDICLFPGYYRRGYIRHNTPGRNWDSLYTWDL